MISIKNLTVKVNRKIILNNISTTFRAGKIYAILGVNGSGKSTLAQTIMGEPLFKVARQSKISFNNISLKNLTIDQRAKKGIFVSRQSPPEIPGVTVKQLLRAVIKKSDLTTRDLLAKLEKFSQELQIPTELLNRSLNDGFSGGERKKMELLQMAILNPDYIFLDEIDTGVDVDAIKIISRFLKKFINHSNKTLIIISHQNKIFQQLKPTQVLILKDGKIKKKGNYTLIKEIEKNGYEEI
jgi:Fe-S cluster assembly ATP-binding protein